MYNYSTIGFVYTISHPLTNDVAYIGATREPDNRFYLHCCNSNKPDVSFWIQLLKDEGLFPLFKIIKITNWHDMHNQERNEIYKHKCKGFLLLNIKPGGNKHKLKNR